MRPEPTADRIWAAVHAERRGLVDDLATLPPHRWSVPSACEGWDVHDVVAHLVDGARATRLGFVRRLATSRFDFDHDNAVGVEQQRRADPRDTLAALAAVADRTTTPPAPLPTRLVEAFVHGEDVRRPLGIERRYPTELVLATLGFQLRTSTAWGGGRQRAAGLRLVATDDTWAAGDGPEVRGTAVALLLAVSGRPVRPGELAGPGAPTLRRRGQRDRAE